jgi:hypothetical protein
MELMERKYETFQNVDELKPKTLRWMSNPCKNLVKYTDLPF